MSTEWKKFTDGTRAEANTARQALSMENQRIYPVDIDEIERLRQAWFAMKTERDTALGQLAERDALLDTPHTADWFEGVRLEAGHQIKRWGVEHDAGKGPADWFWLIGYLAQKAMGAQMLGDTEKAKHHTISTGAAMLNWFRAIVGDSNAMRPGIAEPAAKCETCNGTGIERTDGAGHACTACTAAVSQKSEGV